MTEIFKHVEDTREVVATWARDFGVTDEKGRSVGFRWTIRRINSHLYVEGEGGCYLPHTFPDTTYFSLSTSTTRDSEAYGASQATYSAVTKFEVGAEIERRLRVARARYEKKYA